jgi:DNA-directed RNA polymerase subunit RPC12/RpoP
MIVKCDECDLDLSDLDDLSQKERIPCPNCGSKKRNTLLFVKDSIEVHDYVKGKEINPKKREEEGKTGKKAKKPIYEFYVGDAFSEILNKYVHKTRIIDRENNSYKEVITDEESGKVIHKTEEKLSEHFGHGSDKKQN